MVRIHYRPLFMVVGLLVISRQVKGFLAAVVSLTFRGDWPSWSGRITFLN